MTKIKGSKRLATLVEVLKLQAVLVHDEITTAEEWLVFKTSHYKKSNRGKEWKKYLQSLHKLVNDIAKLKMPDQRIEGRPLSVMPARVASRYPSVAAGEWNNPTEKQKRLHRN